MPLKVHFLNVGQGDCTIIEFPSGRVAMVDIDNLPSFDPDTRNEILAAYHESVEYFVAQLQQPSREQLSRLDESAIRKAAETLTTDPLANFDTHVGPAQDIFRLVITHPDMDHMTGIHRLTGQDSRKKVWNFWHTGPNDVNLASVRADDWHRFDDRDWNSYKALRRSESEPKSIHVRAGMQNRYWADDGISVWAPSADLENLAVEKGQANILSMVLAIAYKGAVVVLGGDATGEETWPNICSRMKLPRVTLLKASHHGRNSGYCQSAVAAMSPLLTVTSVGEKEHDATAKYGRYSDHTVSLRDSGSFRIQVSDEGGITYDGAELSN